MNVWKLDQWELAGYYPYVFELGLSEPRLGKSITDWMPAKVPGSVHADLLRAGFIPDPYTDMNSLACEWVEHKWWAYRTTFDRPALGDGRRLRLHLKGLDDRCRIYLNRQLLAVHEGTFIPFIFDVTDRLAPAGNELVVVFESVPDEESQAGHASHTKTQKSRFGYKWDFGTRLVNIGIWDEALLEETGPGVIGQVWLKPQVCGETAHLSILADCRLCAPAEGCALEASVFAPGETEPLFTAARPLPPAAGAAKVCFDLSIPQPQLWYTNGLGAQPLYRVALRLLCGGEESFRWSGRTGFADLQWVKNENAAGDALPYCLSLHGERVYMKGVNLTPFNQMIGEVTPSQYRSWLTQIRDANINLVRVNGVGLIEKEIFYDLCDEYGILVWQEFIQTSSSMDRTPPTNPDYLSRLTKTSAAALRLKRNHVSLACWCASNELTDRPGVPATFQNPNIKLLQSLVDEYDTGRMMFPASSSGPCEFLDFGKDGISHDVHGPWNYRPEEHYALFNQSDSLLHGELGAEGMAHPDSLRRFLSDGHLTITDMKRDLVWRHHGDWWDPHDLVTAHFGGIPSLEAYSARSQFLQAEALRYALESNRRRKYHNSGSMMWAFGEPFPNVSNTSLSDFYGVPKMAYYALRCAYAPLCASLKYDGLTFPVGSAFSAEVHVSSSLSARSLSVLCEVFAMDGERLHTCEQTVLMGNASHRLFALRLPVTGRFAPFFLVRLTCTDGGQTARNEYLFSTQADTPFAALGEGSANVSGTLLHAEDTRAAFSVANQGERIALYVRPQIPGQNDFLFCPQAFQCLLPGETREMTVFSLNGKKDFAACTFDALI